MIRKKNLLGLGIIIIALTISCQDSNQIKSKDAETVNIVKTNNTKTFANIEPESQINWTASHLGGVNSREGKIFCEEAIVLVNTGKVTNINALIDMKSLTVDNMSSEDALELGDHLKGSDFFNIEKHPFSKFDLTNLEAIGGEYNSKITGNLTILDVSKSITFKGNVNILDNKVSIKSEHFVIDRSDWGLTYHSEGAEGVPLNYLISNNLGFSIDITVTK